MKVFLIITLICLSAPMGMAQRQTLDFDESIGSPSARLTDVAWIAGHWRGEALGGITEEIWTPPLGESMMCAFKLIKDGKVQFYEIVTLLQDSNTLHLRLKHFNRDLTGWEEKEETVDFPLVKIEENRAYFDGFTFENVDEDTMNIYVLLSSKDGAANEMLFPYQRVK